MSLPVVATLGKYQLIRKLATGGMAEVYLTRAAGPGGFEKTLVLKRVLPHLAADPSFLEMFQSEAKLAAQLNHPNVVSIFDFGHEGDSWYLVMEYIDGPNLRALATRAAELGIPVPFTLAAKIVSLACEGLAYAHDFCIHRDVSPDNILVARNGSVKVVDFGIAKAANQQHHTKTGTVKGKFAYMPPEQLRGVPLDKRADLFALGIVLYELITGVKPFDASTDATIMQAILFEPFTPAAQKRPDTPAGLQQIIDKAVEKNRDHRYPDCRALQADLEAFIVSQGPPVGQHQLAQLVAKLANPDAEALATPSPRTAELPTQPALPTPAPQVIPAVSQVVPPAKRRWPLVGLVGGAAVIAALAWPRPAVVADPPAPAPAIPATVPQYARPLHPEVLAPRPPEPARQPLIPPPVAEPVPAPVPAPVPVPVAKGRPKPVKPPTVGFGLVDFRVRPYASVYVDGTLLGDTPFSRAKLPLGMHTVRLVNKDIGKEKTLQLEVKPGDNTLKYNLESE